MASALFGLASVWTIPLTSHWSILAAAISMLDRNSLAPFTEHPAAPAGIRETDRVSLHGANYNTDQNLYPEGNQNKSLPLKSCPSLRLMKNLSMQNLHKYLQLTFLHPHHNLHHSGP